VKSRSFQNTLKFLQKTIDKDRTIGHLVPKLPPKTGKAMRDLSDCDMLNQNQISKNIMKSKSILTALGALGLMFGGSICSHATPLASYQADVLAEPSLVSYYEFGTGTGTLNDYGPGGNNLSGPFNGNPGGGPNTNYVNGIAGGPDQALGFDGSGADCPYVGWPGATTSSFFNFPSGSGTVELWVQAGWSATPGYDPCIFSDLWYSGVYSVFMKADKSAIQIINSHGSPTFNLPAAAGTGWHHLAVEFNSGNCTVIWDGQNLGTQPLALVATEPGTLTLGTTTFYGSTAVPWIGNLDEVAIYSNALLVSHVQAHYDAYVSNSLPIIITQPQGSNYWYVGQARHLSVIASPLQQPAYQWYKNNGRLAGATNSVLGTTSLALTDAGTYT